MTHEFRNGPANTTDATMGEGLRRRVATRKHELELSLTRAATDARTRIDIERALAEVSGLLSKDFVRLPEVVASQMNTWLEATKHVDEHHDEDHRGSTD